MITAEQKVARQPYAGSSDAAAIVGLDSYRSAADVFLEKTGQAETFDGNEATDAGTRLEEVVLDWAGREIGTPFIRDLMKVHEAGLAANFDGIQPAVAEPFIVESKTTGIVGPADTAWGDAGTDQVPERVTIQVHHQFYVAGPEFRICWVPVLIGGTGFRMYRVDRDDALANIIAEKCTTFMEHNVRLGIKPSDFKPSLEVLKRVRRVPNKIVPLADSLVDAWVVAKAAEKQAEEKAKAAQAALLAELGDAEGGIYAGGTITYMEQSRKEYVAKATKFRVLRIKSRKEQTNDRDT